MNAQKDRLTGIDLFLSHYSEIERQISGNGQAWFQGIRRHAIDRFAELGIPTTRAEDWKHTNLSPLTRISFSPAAAEARQVDEARARLDEFTFGGWDAHRIVFVNGRFSEELSSLGGLRDGVKLTSLAKALNSERESVEPHLGKYACHQEHPFVALNTALMRDGAFVCIPPGLVLEKPLHLLFVTAGEENTPVVSHPRNLIVCGSASEVRIVESYVGCAGEVYLTNAVTEIAVGEGAVVDHYRLQQEKEEAFHLATVQIHQERDSHLTTHVISTGSALNRNDVTSVLDGEGITCKMQGLFLTAGHQHVDNHTLLDHAKPHCSSRELFKGILDDKSSGAFTGRVVVRPNAQKTDSMQSSRNLLLSDSATVDPDPQLEIYADDVKCTHGATVGQLDPDAVFYLRTRGIDEAAARGLLTYAFANEVIEQIRIGPLRDHLEGFIAKRYRKEAFKEG